MQDVEKIEAVGMADFKVGLTFAFEQFEKVSETQVLILHGRILFLQVHITTMYPLQLAILHGNPSEQIVQSNL